MNLKYILSFFGTKQLILCPFLLINYFNNINELEPRTVKETVKHGGGSIMIWDCMTSKGPGLFRKIDGILIKETYKNILENELIETLEKYQIDKNQVIFQHDNDPKHTSKIVKEWISNNLQVLRWPAQSPDLNPIEHLWALLKIRLNKYDTPPSGMIELWSRVKEIWESFTENECKKLCHTMPDRIKAVMRSKGRWTNY